MSRFQRVLDEKVSKKEIDEVLKSNDVLVGAEFEFKIYEEHFQYEIEERQDIIRRSEDYDNDRSEYERFHDEWEEKKEEAFDQFDSERTDSIDDGMSDDDATDEYESKVRSWEDENPEPEPPEEPDDYVQEFYREVVEITYDMRESFLRNYMLSDPELKEYVKGDWEFHEDSSLDEGNGIELVSPPMEVDEFLVACERIFKMINKIGYTDNECGLHIGVSLKKGMENIDVTKLILFTDEPYIWKHFDGREANNYVEEMQQHIRGKMYSSTFRYNAANSESRVERISELKTMIKTKDLKFEYYTDHYQGVNIEHMKERNPYIEFRYMGGSGYSKKWNIVKTVIAQYIYNIKLSRDPEFKKKEYIAKCSRILAKFETWTILKELYRLQRASGSKEFEGDDGETKRLLAIRNLQRRLQYLPKLTTKEKDLMQGVGA